MADIVIQPDDSYIENFVELLEQRAFERKIEQEEENNG